MENLNSVEQDQQGFETAYKAFTETYPSYIKTKILDQLRNTEYSRLDQLDQVYLDYTGSSLYAHSQLQQHQNLLENGVFGNPHSNNPTSLAMTNLVEQARNSVLEYFNASPNEYVVIFTPNASGALKLVGESYPFEQGGRFLLSYDNHNSVNGIREFARDKGAEVTYLRTLLPELRFDEDVLSFELENPKTNTCNLFAYAAQSNFTGVQHSLEWINKAHEDGWDVLLDAAAYVPTNRLDLNHWKPDFVSISFYKMFGYPTGVGCLLARKVGLHKLHRPWFAGGTISITSVQGEGWHYLLPNEAGFEDGTINFLNLPAIEIGLRHITDIGLNIIHERVHCLTGWLLNQMKAIHHKNGTPLVHIFGPTNNSQRGGTIAFSLDDPDGKRLDYRKVEALASQENISLRTGCFCNPGTGEIVHHIRRDEMAEAFSHSEPMSFENFFEWTCREYNRDLSTIRISVGIAANFADVYRFIRFLRNFVNKNTGEIDLHPG